MKKKVLHVSYGALGNGGVTSVILSITESLCADFDFDCVTFSQTNTRGELFSRYGKIHYINCYGKKGFKKILEFLFRPIVMTLGIYRLCKRGKYDIIHCHNGYDMAYCLLGAKIAGTSKRIAHSHNAKSPQKTNLLKKYYCQILTWVINRLCTDRIGCSSLACDALFKSYSSRVIFNSIDFSKFPWQRIPHSGLNIVHVGRYSYPKNQSFVIDVIECLKKRGIDLKARLIGFGEDEELLRTKIDKLGLSSIVILEDGKSADIHAAYAESDIMIFPSEYEGFGIVLIEAQATGCFCFASDVVPRDTNVGLMMQLGLSQGASYWAEKVIEFITVASRKQYDDIKARLCCFENSEIAKKYQMLYEE